MLLEKYEEAAEDYSQMKNAKSGSTDGLDIAYFNRGVCYLNLKKNKLAIADFQKVVSITNNEQLLKEAKKAIAALSGKN